MNLNLRIIIENKNTNHKKICEKKLILLLLKIYNKIPIKLSIKLTK